MKEYSAAGPIMSELSMFSTLCITKKMEWWSFYRGDAILVEPFCCVKIIPRHLANYYLETLKSFCFLCFWFDHYFELRDRVIKITIFYSATMPCIQRWLQQEMCVLVGAAINGIYENCFRAGNNN